MNSYKDSIIGYLKAHSLANPNTAAFIAPGSKADSQESLSYLELITRVESLASFLSGYELSGQRALLIYEDPLTFTISFLACICAGIISIPVPAGKSRNQISRWKSIAEDAGATAALCSHSSVSMLQRNISETAGLQGIHIIPTDSHLRPDTTLPRLKSIYNDIAFLQYTSGSTGIPKGVIITQKNLVHNQQLISHAFGCDQRSVICSWLPFHHDMGLIGNILHTIYTGCTCVVLSPLQFMQSPRCWMEAISKYQVTHSGGPNFAYDLCVSRIPATEMQSLDLSSWKVAYNGSEPVRADTIASFSEHFRVAGFRREAFYPCYGLAEATLLVSGHKKQELPLILPAGQVPGDGDAISQMVSSGVIAPGMHVKIIRNSDQKICDHQQEGEICIAGDSITSGYWNKDNSEAFYDLDGRSYLRTGDLGFIHSDELFVKGRLKEMLIVRGRNVYPYDIEHLVATAEPEVEPNGVALFQLKEFPDAMVIVAEIKRNALKDLEGERVIRNIERLVNGSFGIELYDILLTTPLGIPRTTSGKIRRVKCRESYRLGEFRVLAARSALPLASAENLPNSVLLAELLKTGSYDAIRSYILDLVISKTGGGRFDYPGDEAIELADLGIDSLRAMELVNSINRDLNIGLHLTRIFQENTLAGLIQTIENMLWLKNTQTSGKEIII